MLTKSRIRELAIELEASYNPYIQEATEYFIGYTPMYLFRNRRYSKADLVDAYIEIAMKDISNGYKERMVGYYDKWYRYNRSDEGRAYDLGVKEATKSDKCEEEMHIITA